MRTMEQHVIVVGVETTTVRVVEELARSRTAAVVVVPPTADPMVVAELRARDVTIVEAARTDERVLREAGVHRARAVIVLGRDEVASTRTALAVEDADGRVPIVLEVVSPAFGSRLAPLLGDCTVLSPAQLAAPAFIGAAIGDGEVQALRLGGRDVVVGPSTSVAGRWPTSGTRCADRSRTPTARAPTRARTTCRPWSSARSTATTAGRSARGASWAAPHVCSTGVSGWSC